MHAQALTPTKLAKAMQRPKLQPHIHKFRAYGTRPAYDTVKPIADFFKLPVEALLDEREATRIAKERGLSRVDPALYMPKERRGASEGAPASQVAQVVSLIETLSPTDKAAALRALGVAPSKHGRRVA